MKKYINNIVEFRTAFGLPCGWSRSGDFNIELHESLIVEELTELADSRNLIDTADALVDTVYVLLGRLVNRCGGNYPLYNPEQFMCDLLIKVAERKGIDFDACWDEIHSSNMSKLCRTLEEVDLTRDHYSEMGISTTVTEVNGLYAVKCDVDTNGDIKPGKVLKSINYRPANLLPILMTKPLTVLMSGDNPNGYKLEDLLLTMANEIQVKSERVVNSTIPVASVVISNNTKIINHLYCARDIQLNTLDALQTIGYDQGPTGKPRIGGCDDTLEVDIDDERCR